MLCVSALRIACAVRAVLRNHTGVHSQVIMIGTPFHAHTCSPGGSVNATLVECPHQAAAATGVGSIPAAPPWGPGLRAAAYWRRLLPPTPAALAAAAAASLAALLALVQTAAAAWASARAEAGWIWATRAGQSARAASAPYRRVPTQAAAGCQAETWRLLFPLLPAKWRNVTARPSGPNLCERGNQSI